MKGLSSFQAGGIKSKRFLPKNQHFYRKIYDFMSRLISDYRKDAKGKKKWINPPRIFFISGFGWYIL